MIFRQEERSMIFNDDKIKQHSKWEEDARFGSEEVTGSVGESCLQESDWVKAELQGIEWVWAYMDYFFFFRFACEEKKNQILFIKHLLPDLTDHPPPNLKVS